MLLGEFHNEISSIIGRGSQYNTAIPAWTRRACRWLERNYTLQYMKQFVSVTIDLAVASTPRYIELGSAPLKSIKMFRWIVNEEYFNLKMIDPEDLDRLEVGQPRQYWLDGVRRIVLDKTPDENLEGELQLIRYSSWPTELTAGHYLLDAAEDVLMAQTLIMAAPVLRDPKLISTWTQVRDEGLNTLTRSDDELQHANSSFLMEAMPSR
jgi:hypothetical protein